MRRAAEQLIRFCGRHRRGYRVLLAALGGLAALAVALRGHFTNDVSRLLPDTPEMVSLFRILHRAHLAETIQFEFVSAGDITEHLGFLEGAAARLAAMPGLRGVTFRCRSDEPLAEVAALGGLAPRFLPPTILDDADPERAARNALKQLALPAPGQVELARNRPFGWENGLLMKLKALDEAVGFRLDPETPFFVTADRHRAMIAAESDVQLGDADAVRRLFAAAREAVGPLPPGVELRIVSGCSHTLGNEEVLKRDAAIAGGVSLALFLLLFLWFYRGDGRALWIPFLPLYASLLALGAMTFLFREICLYVIGLGGCITGLAVDQGIHVYAAFRGEAGERRTAALAAPMALSAATSIAVFAALALTGIAAYIQLAVFAGLSLALSGLLALTLLPQLIDRGHRLRELLPGRPAAPRRWAWWMAAILLVAGLAALPGVLARADFALTSLDGTPESILREERDFDAAWRRPGPEMAALAAAGDDGEAALEHLERLTAELEKRHVAVAGPPRPSRREQAANRAAWRSPEAARKRAELAQACRDACRRSGLPAAFFDPFFIRLDAAAAADDLDLPPMLMTLDRKLVKEFPGGGAAIGLLPDTPENVRAARAVLREHGGGAAALLSKEGFRQLIREELGGRFRLLLPLSAGAALLLLFIVFRRVSDVALAMTPVVLAASGVVLAMRLAGFRATPAAAFALVLLIGLAADYGIYAVCQLRDPAALSVGDPILLSAATTVAGAGSLLFSHHPALFGTGVVLAPGIAIACWAGVWLVPRLKRGAIPKMALLMLLSVSALFVGGCTHTEPWASYAGAPALEERMALYPETPFGVQAVANVSFAGRDFRFLLAAEIDPAGAIRCAAVDPGSGAMLFRSGDAGEGAVFGPAFADGVPGPLRRFAEGLPGDLRRIFILKDDRPLAVEEKSEYIAVYAEEVTWRLSPADSLERRCGEFPCRAWRCEYREAGRDVCYISYDENYVLSLKIGKWWRMEK